MNNPQQSEIHDIIPDMGRALDSLARDTSALSKPTPLPPDAPARSKRPYKRKTNTSIDKHTETASPLTGTRIAIKQTDLTSLETRPVGALYAQQVGRMPDGSLYTLLKSAETGSLYVKAHKWSRSGNGRLSYEARYFHFERR